MSFFYKLKEFIAGQSPFKLFARFYAVGILLFAIPFTRQLFFAITPLSILLVVIVMFLFHIRWTPLTIGVFLFIGISSFFLEVVGTNTGVIFGAYSYDTTLGIKIWNTPLLIAVNWVYLIYATQSLISANTKSIAGRIVGGALLTVLYDLVLELAAPSMQMWHFDTFYPPLLNFVMWFVVASLYHTLMVVAKVQTDNAFARALYWVQLAFFAIIGLYSLIVIR